MRKHITDRFSISGKQKAKISKEALAKAIAQELDENETLATGAPALWKTDRQAVRGEILVKVRNILSKSTGICKHTKLWTGELRRGESGLCATLYLVRGVFS